MKLKQGLVSKVETRKLYKMLIKHSETIQDDEDQNATLPV